MVKAIFLDRDGIVNKAIVEKGLPYSPTRLGDIFLTDGIKDLIKKWHDEEYIVIVVTNQPDVANHIITKNKVDKINNYLKSIALFDDIFTCYHNGKDDCDCKKPKTGLFLQAKEKYDIDFSQSYVIGDRWKDIEAGKNIGCKTIFVDYHYDEERPNKPDYTAKSVSDIKRIWSNINGKNILRWG